MMREKRKGRTTALLLTGALLLLLLATHGAWGEPVPASGLTKGESSRRNLSTTNVTSVDAQGGNVTRLDINGMSITKSWQGYYGNISGNIILADANNNSLYEWGNGTSVTGKVYASRNSTISWATINCTNASGIAAEESYLGQSASDADSVTNTFNQTDHPSFLVAGRNMTGCYSTNTFVNGAFQESHFHEILLSDNNGRIVYTTIIDNDQVGYDGSTHDFQLLVGENEHIGSEGATQYYFFVELG